MPDHADDLRQLIEQVQVDALAERILVGEILLGKDLIDHDHQRRVFIVVGSEEPAVEQRNAHRLQIVRFDDVVDGPVHVVVVGRLRLPIEPEELLVITAQGDRSPCLGDRLDTWDGGEFVVEPTEGGADRIRVGAHHRRRK